MRIQILGTAAAEGWPGIFCGCDACLRAKAAGGKNLRSGASILIDDIYKIDLPPDTYYHVIRHSLDLSRLKYLFFTHSHGDHFALDEIEYLRYSFASNLKNAPLRIYGNHKVISAIKSRCDRRALPVELNLAEPYIPIIADNLTFTPVIAEHATNQVCLNYVIQSPTATVLYASDTGLYGKSTMEFLSQMRFDVMIVECTRGTSLLPSKTHMSVRDVLRLKARLTRSGAVTPETRVVLTHLSHNIGLLHEEMEATAHRKGLEVAFDGMVIEA